MPAVLAVFFLFPAGGSGSGPQDSSRVRPTNDYMNKVLGRNTEPIGLKEDKLLQKLLRQSNMKWAIRAAGRHILD